MGGETTQTTELSEAQVAYQIALARLEEALPKVDKAPVVVDPAAISWPRLLLGTLAAVPRALVRLIRLVFGEAGEEVGEFLHDLKVRLAGFAQEGPVILGGTEIERRNSIRSLVLETLWARDHVQDAIERRDGASYQSKRNALAYVMDNEARLQRLGQLALEVADLDTADLREAQPTPPPTERWWWYLNYPRAKRARRLNTIWFVLALIPALASLFLIVVVIFYFLAPPGAAAIYHIFGQRAVDSGNAAEAELYLESAARLDPDPHAAYLLEVGCLYEALGAPERAQTVFERVLEADSRLLLASYHLSQLYIDRGENAQALQLLEDGLNLLDTGREDMARGDYSFLPGVNSEDKANQMEYLLRLARGRAYLESNAPEQARTNPRDAEALFDQIQTESAALHISAESLNRFDLSCGPKDDRRPFILGTELDLHYYLARTYDALCSDEATITAAQEEWRLIRNGRPNSSRQEAWRDDAVRRLSSGQTCTTNYGLTAETVSTSAGG